MIKRSECRCICHTDAVAIGSIAGPMHIMPCCEPDDNLKVENEWKRPKEVLKKAMFMKKNMLAKGLLRAKAKCPYCAGHWQAVLCGHKKHMHMACDGDCKSMLME